MIWFYCEANYLNLSPLNEPQGHQMNTVEPEIDDRSNFAKLLENYRNLEREN